MQACSEDREATDCRKKGVQDAQKEQLVADCLYDQTALFKDNAHRVYPDSLMIRSRISSVGDYSDEDKKYLRQYGSRAIKSLAFIDPVTMSRILGFLSKENYPVVVGAYEDLMKRRVEAFVYKKAVLPGVDFEGRYSYDRHSKLLKKYETQIRGYSEASQREDLTIHISRREMVKLSPTMVEVMKSIFEADRSNRHLSLYQEFIPGFHEIINQIHEVGEVYLTLFSTPKKENYVPIFVPYDTEKDPVKQEAIALQNLIKAFHYFHQTGRQRDLISIAGEAGDLMMGFLKDCIRKMQEPLKRVSGTSREFPVLAGERFLENLTTVGCCKNPDEKEKAIQNEGSKLALIELRNQSLMPVPSGDQLGVKISHRNGAEIFEAVAETLKQRLNAAVDFDVLDNYEKIVLSKDNPFLKKNISVPPKSLLNFYDQQKKHI